MRWIPPGEFTMGTDNPNSMSNERPAHKVKLDGFWMDETTVTNAQFALFVKGTGYVTTAEQKPNWEELKKQVPPGTPKPDEKDLVPGSLVYTPPDHPVSLDDMANWWRWVPGASWRHPVGPGTDIKGRDNEPAVQVSWDDAVAYAKWAGKRLPTEAEWEYASRGGLEGKRFVWGDEFRPGGKYMANTFQGHFPDVSTPEDGYARRSPVKSFPANGYGLYDMSGNVWEWTSDFFTPGHPEAEHACCAPRNPRIVSPDQSYDLAAPGAHIPRRVTKGGSHLCAPSYCLRYRPAARQGEPVDSTTSHIGFRCVSQGRQ
jgi:formylglycine-generating enzyme required for sulfatase activity